MARTPDSQARDPQSRRARARASEPLITRREMAGWVDGPGGNIVAGTWPGERLGLPESGPTSLARPGRRIGALFIDWSLSLALGALLFQSHPLAVLLIFAGMHVLGLSLFATTVGKALVRIQVVPLGGGTSLPLPRVALRTLLLCLVIPLMVVDPDGRSLHDKAARSVEIVM
ncbi:MAG: RDD family protein [Micrococcus sp.]|nr:RDD family protein [Micrococcus sp.]